MILHQGLHKLSQGEEYLAQAQWTVLKTPDCSSAIKSKLARNLGLLYAAQGNYEESLRHLADDVSVNSNNSYTILMQACMLRFFKGQGHQGIFSLLKAKGHPMRKLLMSIRAFQGHQGNDQGAWRQSPALPS